MQDVSVIYLYILDLELGLPIDGNDTSVVLLTTLLGIKVGLVQNDTKGRVGREFRSRVVEFGGVIYRLDGRFDIIQTCEDVSLIGQLELVVQNLPYL